MENPKVQKEKKTQDLPKKPQIWDCKSSLYDSFQLKSFERQLFSAINSRTLSMPHFSDHHRVRLDPHFPPPPPESKKHSSSSKISRSLHRLIRTVFKPKQQSNCSRSSSFQVVEEEEESKDDFYVMEIYDYEFHKPIINADLSPISEAPEHRRRGSLRMLSPTRQTASSRWIPTSNGIWCV